MSRRHLAFALPVLLAACGSVEDDPTQPDAGSDPSADAPPGVPDAGGGGAPTILSVTPTDGAAGVRADAVIVVAFSEPMDAASVAAAWTSADLPAAAVQLGWNLAGDTLTVTPAAPLELATGTGLDPSTVAPRAYTFGLAATATDASGVALAVPLASSFTTARRMTTELARLSPLSCTVRGDGFVLSEGGTVRPVGDTTANLQYKTFASFALPALPAGAEVEDATLAASQNGPSGLPYALGTVDAFHINTATLDLAAFAAAPLAPAGVLSADATPGAKSLDVTAAFADDVANAAARGDRTQFRLELGTATDADGVADAANFSRDAFALSVTYLAD